MEKLKIVLIASLLMCLPLSVFAGPLVHFEDQDTGDSVEGLGTIHPMLDIQAEPGTAVVIEGLDSTYSAYGAPNVFGPTYYPRNNCLENAEGQRVNADVDGDKVLDQGVTPAKGFGQPPGNSTNQFYSVDFAKSVSDFSMRIFDFGDFNPTKATHHSITLTAYDDMMNMVAMDGITYNSAGVQNPTTSDYGNLLALAGDACTSPFGLPGYLELSVSNPLGFTKVELTMTGQDPKVGFDSLDFTPCTRTIGYWKNHPWPTNANIVVGNGEVITMEDGSDKYAEEKLDKGILWNATGKNFSMLCAQLIAAKLNCYGGDCVPDGVIQAADDLLEDEEVLCADSETWDFLNKTVKRSAARRASQLDEFNNMYECIEMDEYPQ